MEKEELEKLWKEGVVAYFKVLKSHLPVGSVETTKLCIFGVRTESSRTPTFCRSEAVPFVRPLVGLAACLFSCLYFLPYNYPWPIFMISFFLQHPFFSEITSFHATDPDPNKQCRLQMPPVSL